MATLMFAPCHSARMPRMPIRFFNLGTGSTGQLLIVTRLRSSSWELGPVPARGGQQAADGRSRLRGRMAAY
jgi:hypothetical protein